MKLLIPCMECLKVSGQPPTFQLVEVRDDSTYKLTCSRGHQTVAVLQEQKFEVLFEVAVHAILDGYYREAVSSFTSSLERFYEFAIRVLLESSGSSDENSTSSEELFKKCLKKLSDNSQKELAAFIVLWSYCFGEMPELLVDKQVQLRNNVIHKGIIPTEKQALEYGNAVIEVVRPNIQQLQERFSNEVEKVTSRDRDVLDKRAKVGNNELVVSMETLTPIILTSEQDSNIEEYLSKLAKYRQMIDILKQQPTDS